MDIIESDIEKLGFQLRLKGRPADYPPEMTAMLLALKGMNFISNSGDEDWQGMFKGQAPKAWLLELIKTIPAELHAGLEISFGGWPLEELQAPNAARAELWAKLDEDVIAFFSRTKAPGINMIRRTSILLVGELVAQTLEGLVEQIQPYDAPTFRRKLRNTLRANGLSMGMNTLGWVPPNHPSRTGAPE